MKYLLKKGLNTLNELKNAEITKQKKRTPKRKELLNLFNHFSGTILTDETESKSQEEENENENEKTLIPLKGEKENEKEEKNENEDKNEDENKNMLLEYIEDVDDKLFKKYSDGKDFNSFVNEFDRATKEEDKKK